MHLRSVRPIKAAKYSYILISAVLCAAGLALILFPSLPVYAISLFFGISMLVLGIVKLVGYCSRDLFRLAFQYDLQFGILLCILGIVTLTRLTHAAEFICIAFGISMLADSLFRGKTALDARRFGIRQWWLTLALAIAAGIAGILTLLSPIWAARVINTVLGVSLLLEGVLGLSVAVSMVKIVDHQQPDEIDAEFYEVWEER